MIFLKKNSAVEKSTQRIKDLKILLKWVYDNFPETCPKGLSRKGLRISRDSFRDSFLPFHFNLIANAEALILKLFAEYMLQAQNYSLQILLKYVQ